MKLPLTVCVVALLTGCSPYKNQSAELKRLASKGDTDAMLRLAGNCAYGRDGAPQDSKLALEWYKKAAEAGNPQAQARYGRILFCGALGAPKDMKMFSFWTEKASKSEADEALLILVLRKKIGLATLLYIEDNGKMPTSLKDLKDGRYTDDEVPDQIGQFLHLHQTATGRLRRGDIRKEPETVMISFADQAIPGAYTFIMADGSLRGETGISEEAAAASAGLQFLR